MIVITAQKNYTYGGQRYLAGHRYLASEAHEQEARTINPTALGVSFAAELYLKPYTGQDLTNKTILIMRSTGIGDLLMIEPVVRAIKDKYHNCTVNVASQSMGILLNNPNITKLLPMPCDFQAVQEADFHLHFQNLLEGNSKEARTKHAVDLFLGAAGLSDTTISKVPELHFLASDSEWVAKQTHLYGNYTVAMQLESSNPTRNFPVGRYHELVTKLAAEPGISVLLIGNTMQQVRFGQLYKGNKPNVHVLSQYTPHQCAAICTKVDLVFGPDSYLIQVGGALGKPTVGVYNAFPSTLRMSYFKNAIGLDILTTCSPCFTYGPCTHGLTPPPCWQQIGVDDVLSAMDYLKEKTTGYHFTFADSLKPNPRTNYAR